MEWDGLNWDGMLWSGVECTCKIEEMNWKFKSQSHDYDRNELAWHKKKGKANAVMWQDLPWNESWVSEEGGWKEGRSHIK